MAWSSGGASARVGDSSWSAPMIVRGFAPSPTKSLKVALVNCSCHWATSLMGRFLQCPIVWMRFVQHLLAAKPPSVGLHNGDVAYWQAREPREKNWLSLAHWYSTGDWLVHSSTRQYNHLSHSFTFPHTSCSKLFSVARIVSLLCSLSSPSGAL